ncbi:MAG: hypothetical protein ACRD3W_23855 [Terriglobales bacterium]
MGTPAGAVLRLHPEVPATLKVETFPAAGWVDVGQLHVEIKPPVEGLEVQTSRNESHASVAMEFQEPDDWEDDAYPLETLIRITTMIKGYAEPRLLQRSMVISKPKMRKPRKPPVLSDLPTYIKVTSRQPVSIVAGGPDVHVRLRWDGNDALGAGSSPEWTFSAICIDDPALPPIAFTRPKGGRFELLIQPPKDLASGTPLTFDVIALGPGGTTLKTSFLGEIVDPPLPRKIKQMVPEPSSQRRPPYELHYIKEDQWKNAPCWGEREWTGGDSGCFHEPSQTKPLVLIINEDMELLRQYRETLTSRKLDPTTIKDRVTRYTSHIAFHLYQMYQHFRDTQKSADEDPSIKVPEPEQMSGEVSRVAATLIKVMEVSR